MASHLTPHRLTKAWNDVYGTNRCSHAQPDHWPLLFHIEQEPVHLCSFTAACTGTHHLFSPTCSYREEGCRWPTRTRGCTWGPSNREQGGTCSRQDRLAAVSPSMSALQCLYTSVMQLQGPHSNNHAADSAEPVTYCDGFEPESGHHVDTEALQPNDASPERLQPAHLVAVPQVEAPCGVDVSREVASSLRGEEACLQGQHAKWSIVDE
jgi:hypothetical protein